MNDAVWILILMVSILITYQIGYHSGYKNGEGPWIWSHRTVLSDENIKREK